MKLSHENTNPTRKPTRPKPSAILGAGQLVSTVWKLRNGKADSHFRFNVFRMGAGGRVGQRFTPDDLFDLIKLVRLLAITLADEGTVPPTFRSELITLASKLDPIIDRIADAS